jgi:hypothetical protein
MTKLVATTQQAIQYFGNLATKRLTTNTQHIVLTCKISKAFFVLMHVVDDGLISNLH